MENGFILQNLQSYFHIWSQIEFKMCKTWILNIPANGFYFRPRPIFQSETETWMC